MRFDDVSGPDRHLVGLENRLKGRDKIEERISHDMRKRGLSAEQALAAMKDLIRYTFQYPDDTYADGVRADVERMTADGFGLAGFRNMWSSPHCKGITSVWRVPGDGQAFELRFHTAASFGAMEETRGVYKRLRALPTDRELVRELRAYQRFVTAQVPIPAGALGLTSGADPIREEK
jgi:hypothetical protein